MTTLQLALTIYGSGVLTAFVLTIVCLKNELDNVGRIIRFSLLSWITIGIALISALILLWWTVTEGKQYAESDSSWD